MYAKNKTSTFMHRVLCGHCPVAKISGRGGACAESKKGAEIRVTGSFPLCEQRSLARPLWAWRDVTARVCLRNQGGGKKRIRCFLASDPQVPFRFRLTVAADGCFRCLQDGAEEFFLKPVKLADMKKLKSHLLKRKQPKEAQAQQGQAVELEPEQQLDPRTQPAHDAEETAAEPPPAASNGTADGGNKRKAAAMEEEGMLAVMTVAAPESSTKPRLSTTSNSLAVET